MKERGIKGVRFLSSKRLLRRFARNDRKGGEIKKLINKGNKSKIYLWKSKGVVADEA